MVPHERGEARDVLVTDLEAVGAELGEGSVHVSGVVEDQALRTRPRAPSWSYPNWPSRRPGQGVSAGRVTERNRLKSWSPGVSGRVAHRCVLHGHL